PRGPSPRIARRWGRCCGTCSRLRRRSNMRQTAARMRRGTIGGALLRGRGEPAAFEAGAHQALTHVRILAHHAPDHRAAIVFDHREDRALVDAEIIAVDPAESGNVAAMAQWALEIEAAIERIEKAVLRIN